MQPAHVVPCEKITLKQPRKQEGYVYRVCVCVGVWVWADYYICRFDIISSVPSWCGRMCYCQRIVTVLVTYLIVITTVNFRS